MSRAYKSGWAFTLIELMAVVMIIALLATISLGVAGYLQRRVGVATARAQIAALETAIEMYKSDWGYYPRSNPERISADGTKEAANNTLLYRALTGTCTGCNRKYMVFPPKQLLTNPLTRQLNYFDPWGSVYNYYNSPTSTYSVVNSAPAGWTAPVWRGGYTVGGQVNATTFDVFSYGPDKFTYVTNAVAYGYGGSSTNYSWYSGPQGAGWTTPIYAQDDINNWGK